MLARLSGFRGSFPFVFYSDSHDGIIGLMRIVNDLDSLDLMDCEFLERSQGRAARAFVSGRLCVRALQKQLDIDEFRLPPGDFGPIWPRGLVGSISHSRELVAATILRDAESVGIDIEKQGRLKVGAVRRVATRRERGRYSKIANFDWTLLFSAKESIFKAVSPLVSRYIGFQEIEISLDLTNQSFSVSYLGDHIEKELFRRSRGQWGKVTDHLITVVTVD